MVRVSFHKGGASLEEGSVQGFGIGGKGGRIGEERRGKKRKMGVGNFFKIK